LKCRGSGNDRLSRSPVDCMVLAATLRLPALHGAPRKKSGLHYTSHAPGHILPLEYPAPPSAQPSDINQGRVRCCAAPRGQHVLQPQPHPHVHCTLASHNAHLRPAARLCGESCAAQHTGWRRNGACVCPQPSGMLPPREHDFAPPCTAQTTMHHSALEALLAKPSPHLHLFKHTPAHTLRKRPPAALLT
jgi:hypothetical protein